MDPVARRRLARISGHLGLRRTSRGSSETAGDADGKEEWYLGLDCSTQGLKAEIIDGKLALIASAAVNFDRDLSHYNTRSGAHVKELRATAPSIMFAEALDLLLSKMSKKGGFKGSVDLTRIVGIGVSGQQHGSVFWKRGAEKKIMSLDPGLGLREQLEDRFTLDEGPIWMDSSTEKECAFVGEAIGGERKVLELSGSRPYERFTGNQIRRIILNHPKEYENTERISLISSMLTSILIGRYAPIDVSDGSGMNLMNIRAKTWSWELLQAVTGKEASSSLNISALGPKAEALFRKLGGDEGLVPSHKIVGNVSNYLVSRYGFSRQCRVVAGSGDNPCSLVGLRGTKSGDAIISLGTSDTFFAVTENPHMGSLDGHVLVNPIDSSTYIKMLCFKNGSITRERVRERFANGTWQGFNQALKDTPPGNHGCIGIYFLDPEIVPTFNYSNVFRFSEKDRPLGHFPNPSQEVRALLEGHFLSMRLHSEDMHLPKLQRIIATGGASANPAILQLIADIFKTRVYVHKSGSGSAALGAALRAMHGVTCAALHSFVALDECLRAQGASPRDSFFRLAATPKNGYVYDNMMKRYADLERAIVLVGLYASKGGGAASYSGAL